MDRKITLLASMALIGTKATATMRYQTNDGAFKWPSYSTDNLTNIDDIDTSTDDTRMVGYSCIRTGAWFFFPQFSKDNVPALNRNAADANTTYLQTFYGWDHDNETQFDDKSSVSGNIVASASSSNIDQTTDLATSASVGLDMTSRCCKVFDGATGASINSCKRVSDNRYKTTGTVTFPSYQIPIGRIFYQGTNPGIDLTAIKFTAANEFAAVSVSASVAVATEYVDAAATAWQAAQAVFTWNSDFLLASVHQSHKYGTSSDLTGSDVKIICSSPSDKATQSPQWLTVDSLYDNALDPKKLLMGNYSKKTKCTWFIKVDGTASTTSAAASFILSQAKHTAFNLHWAEWTAGSIATASLVSNANVTPFFTGAYSATYEWPNPIKLGADKITSGTSTGGQILFKTTDKSMTPAYGLTRGNVAWYSQVPGPFMNDATNGITSVDYNGYKLLLDQYNNLITAYNTAASAHSILALNYNTKVTDRLAQIEEDSYTFDDQIAIPPVPCLGASKLDAWPGYNFPSTPVAFSTITTAILKKTTMFYQFTHPDTGVLSNELLFADSTFDMRSGWMQTATDETTVQTPADYAGTLHVYGLLGQEQLDTTAADTILKAKKAFRFYKDTPDTLDHYMMVGVYPYALVYTTPGSIELTVYKNEWETEKSTDFIVQTATGPANFVADDKQLGNAKALAATAAAFAAVAMTLQ